MEGHGYVTYELRDTVGTAVKFEVLDYTNFEELENSFKELESEHGVLDFEKKEFIKDDSVITVKFLINQIDHAFEAWQEATMGAWIIF